VSRRQGPNPPENSSGQGSEGAVPDHLSQIITVWTIVQQAHASTETGEAPEPTRVARAWLWNQYQHAILKYLRSAIRNENDVDDLFQQFGFRILRGDFHNAKPEKGKFRHYLKSILRAQVSDYYRRINRDPVISNEAVQDRVDRQEPGAEADREFLENWRADLLQGTWQRLHDHETSSGRFSFSALQLKADHGEESSEQLARRLSKKVGHTVTAGWYNRQVHEARKLIAAFLLEEVARTLSHPTADAIEDELITLGLLNYPSVGDALHEVRRRGDGRSSS
jgi:DNA-directed RNA polymerase specialized sigma24 family protein